MSDKEYKNLKSDRILKLFFRALKGESLSVKALANESNVSTRSITRDINDLKAFLSNYRDVLGNAELNYSAIDHCYTLEMENLFSNKELFSIAKVLIGCKAFSKEELLEIITKLKGLTSFSDKNKFDTLFSKELLYYDEINSNCDSVIDNVWRISTYIQDNKIITITYYKKSKEKIHQKIIPLYIIFSEYYFYLIAYKCDDKSNNKPIYYRVDKITDVIVHREEPSLDYPEFDEELLRDRGPK